MVNNNTVLIVIIIASLFGATDIGAWQLSLWQPNAGIEFFSTLIFVTACVIGLLYCIWESSKRLRK